jgi:putative transposase
MLKTYKYRLYPTRKQTKELEWTLETCRILYNSCLVDKNRHYEQTGKGLSRIDQQKILVRDKKNIEYLMNIHSQVLQDVLFRVEKAYKAFFRRLKDRNGKAGYPRFKAEGRYDSVTYPQMPGFELTENGLRLSKIGTVKLKKHRNYTGSPKTCIVKKQADKWYACLSVEYGIAVPKKTVIRTDKIIGLDMGINTFAVCSDKTEISTEKHYRNSEEKLAKTQKELSRKTRGSKNRIKARIKVAKQHEHIANQRKDALHKESRRLISSNPDCVAVEDLKIRNMVRNTHLSKSIHDSGWGQFLSYVEYKAEEAGILFIRVNPRNTSQECICGHSVPKTLSDRTHSCPQCGLIAPRDYVSALVVKQRCINKIRQELPEYTLVETGSMDDIGYSNVAALKSIPSLKQEALQFIGE